MATQVYITGVGAFLPNAPVNNEDIDKVIGLPSNQSSRVKQIILRNNGIKMRHYALDRETLKTTHSNAQLSKAAIDDLLQKTDFDLRTLDCLSCGTTSPDQWIPNHAVMVHAELGNPPCEAVASAGVCGSGVSALKYAYMNVALGLAKNAIVSGSEQVSSLTRASNFEPEIQARKLDAESNPAVAFEQEYLRWMLSDGAGAVLLEPSPRPDKISFRIDWIEIVSFANEMDVCMYSGGIKNKDGTFVPWREVPPTERQKLGVHNLSQDSKLLARSVTAVTVQAAVGKVLEKHPMKPEDITWLLPHYSSEFFRQDVFDKFALAGFKIPYEKWFTNLTTKGNTGAASMYLMLEELHASEKLKRGDKILCWVPESARFSASFVHLTAV